MADHTPYQKKIIRRYYDNAESIGYQRLSELVAEVYLAEGKKAERLWKQIGTALEKVDAPKSQVDRILETRDPKLLAELLSQITGKGSKSSKANKSSPSS